MILYIKYNMINLIKLKHIRFDKKISYASQSQITKEDKKNHQTYI